MKLKVLILIGGLIALILKIFEEREYVEKTELNGVHIIIPAKADPDDDYEYDEGVDIIGELESMEKKEQKEEIKKLAAPLQVEEKKVSKNSDLNKREERIIALLEKKGKIDTDLLNSAIKDVSVRTLRRDLDHLEKIGVMKKVGKTKGSYYVKA